MISISKVRKFLNPALQTALFLLSVWFIYHQVFRNTAVRELFAGMRSGMNGDYPFVKLLELAIIVLLMGLNWLTETRKWQLLVQHLEPMPLSRAAIAVLSGISLSFFTPNGIGEYPARSLALRKTGMSHGILVTIAGSMAQMLVTIVAGSLSLLLVINQFCQSFNNRIGAFYILSGLLITLSVTLLALYLNLPQLCRKLPSGTSPVVARLMQKLTVFSIYRRRELLIILLLSSVRYLLFTTQYYLLLRFFGLSICFFTALKLIAVVYLITTLIPSVALTELGIRGSVAIWVFSLYQTISGIEPQVFNVAVLSASVSLWLINIGLPAAVGSLLIFRLQFGKK